MSRLPLIGITMGDPSGIGPEIIVRAMSGQKMKYFCCPVVLGDRNALSSAILKSPFEDCRKMEIRVISSPGEAEARTGIINLIPISDLKDGTFEPGRPSLEGGEAMVQYILKAVDMAKKGEIDAMVTCPISKILMQKAGYKFEGHTQLISHLTDSNEYVMMLAGERLRVVLVTIHCGLKEVPRILTSEMIQKTIRITARAFEEDFGIINPRLAVAALNPHGGESCLFGSEERDIIIPAVEMAEKEGYRVEGPFPADTLFHKATSGEYEAVVCMYHDQGLIPLKLLHFSDAVNVTLGLPIIRTSVDHGTAYDIAGTGKADPSSLRAAIEMAAVMAGNKKVSGDIQDDDGC
jgi:4-hydroxythreonine-4-phosphate dehydrogenase